MIVREFYKTRNDGVKLYRTYSDSGLFIKQNETGTIYDEAIDIEGSSYTYSETKDKIEGYTNQATEEDLYGALAELGVSEDD